VSDIVIVGGHAGVAGPMQFSARGERVHHVASLHRLQPFFERVVTLARSEAAAFHRDAVGDSGPDLEPTNPDAAAEWFDGWMRRVRAWDASGSLGREHGWGMHGSQRVNLFESGALSHFNALAESVLTDPGLQWLARHAVTDLEPLPIQAATGLVLATGFADEMAADDLIALSPYGRACCAATQQVDATGEFWRAFEAASVSELRWCEQFANHDAVLFEGVAQAVCPSYVAPTRNASKSIGTRISELRSEELLDLVRARRAVVARVQPPVSAAEPIRVASKARGREAHLLDIMRTRTSAGLDGRMGLGH